MDDIRIKISELMRNGWTRQAIADELDVHRTSIHEWEVGKHAPTHPKLVLAALDSLLERKRIPKQRRYAPGSRQRKAKEDDD